MAEQFFLVDTNPNDAIGGCGCVCNPAGDKDCVGPFAVFPAAEAVENLSPHVVIGLGCARAIGRAAQSKKNVLDAS